MEFQNVSPFTCYGLVYLGFEPSVWPHHVQIFLGVLIKKVKFQKLVSDIDAKSLVCNLFVVFASNVLDSN